MAAGRSLGASRRARSGSSWRCPAAGGAGSSFAVTAPATARATPELAGHELALLRALRAEGLPVPTPLAVLDAGGPEPCLLLEHVEGRAEAPARTAPIRLAGFLARLHRIDPRRHELGFLRRQEDVVTALLAGRPAEPDAALGEERLRAALARAWPPAKANAPALLHGDLWPGNTLWRGEELAAVLDWEDAALGDPLADLANTRLELVWALGAEAAAELTSAYATAMPGLAYHALPVWDLVAALRPAGRLGDWGLDERALATMRLRHLAFVEAALAALEGA